MQEVRLIISFVIGGGLIFLEYQSQYSITPFDGIFWIVLLLAGAIVFIWNLKDIAAYKSTKQLISFSPSMVLLTAAGITAGLAWKKDREFAKPSLLNVFYDGDFNGRGIDFKTDSTYILDDMAIGFIDYSYGTYSIEGNRLKLNPPTKGNTHRIQYLSIIDDTENGFLLEIDSAGTIANENIKYRIVVDNRK